MSIEYTYYCDAPPDERDAVDEEGRERETCPGHARTMIAHPHMPHGMLRLYEEYPGLLREFHFCGWDCVLRFAAKIPPVERIYPDGSDDPRSAS